MMLTRHVPRTLKINPSADGDGRPEVWLDGTVSSSNLRIVDRVEMPFAAVYLDDTDQYDLEVWTNGNLIHRVPPRSAASEVVYEKCRKNAAQPSRHEGPPPMTLAPEEARAHRKAVEREMATHPGRVAELEWTALRRMASLHEKNKGELLAILTQLGGDAMLAIEMVQNVRPPVVRDAVNLELDQRLHNYVASAGSLIDQTRRLVDRYPGTSFALEYVTRKDGVIKTPVVAFVRDLRNFALHRSLPFLGHNISFSNEERSLTSEVRLSTAQLRTWKGWSATARKYLEVNPHHIDLHSAVTEHALVFDQTWSWLFAQHPGIHRNDAVAVNELIGEYNWYLSGGAEGRPRRSWAMLDFPYV